MRRSVFVVLFFGVALIINASSLVASSTPDINTEILSTLEFQAPDNPSDRLYLNLPNRPLFRLPDMKGKILFLELFSMYCPICQAEAPVINTLFRLLGESPDLKPTIRMLGIGAGNTPFEVDVYRKKYQVPFPLIPDDTMVFRKAYPEEIRTPTFILVKIDEQGKATVLFRHVGQMKDAQLYVDAISKAVTGK